MKITKDKFHEDLRSSTSKLSVVSFLLSKKWGFRLISSLFKLQHGKQTKGLVNEERFIKSNHDAPDIRIRIYKPTNITTQLPVILYLHGGGYAVGCPEQADELFKEFGHSAGGGLTAAVTLKARDTQDVNIAFQMPIYPMIDDRQSNESSKFISPVWDAKTNALGWDFYLKNLKAQNAEIPAYAAPSRNEDYSNFPPTITLVGDAEPFRDETIQYVEALKKFNIPVEFKLYERCFHGFDVLVKSEISKDALNFTFDSYAQYYDKYIIE